MITKVGIVDDHVITSTGLKEFVEMDSDFQVSFISHTSTECLIDLSNYSIDILLMDIILPDIDGFELLDKIRSNGHDCKVIFITSLNDDNFYYKSFNSKVNGILCKDASISEIHNALHTVRNNSFYIQPKYSDSFHDSIIKHGNTYKLSKREMEVLSYISKGLSNKDISNIMCISELTVKTHVSNIMNKLDVVDRTQAAILAIKNGIV